MLHVPEHPVPRAKFPIIDVHTHLFGAGRKAAPDSPEAHAELAQVAKYMDECNLQTLINLTGGNSQTMPAIRKTMSEFGGQISHRGGTRVVTRQRARLCAVAGGGD